MPTHHPDKRTLTASQVAVLRWIAAGRPDGVYSDYSHRQSARALENRGLARVWGHGPSWRAELTPKGTAALEHLSEQADEAADISALEPSPVDRLLERLVAAGGELDVGAEFTRDELQHCWHAALKSQVRPHAQRLAYESTGDWRSPTHRVMLAPYFEDTIQAQPVPVPETIGKLHPLARRLREEKYPAVSKEHLTRAVRIMNALAVEAEKRGMTVSNEPVGKSKRGDITLARNSDSVTLELRELPPNKGAARPFVRDNSWRGWDAKPRFIRNEKFTSTGVLQLQVVTQYGEGGNRYRDTRGKTVESLLPKVLLDVELAHLYADARREAQKRAAERRKEHRRRLYDAALKRFADDARITQLDEQVGRWERAATIRRFADALEAADDSDPAKEWTDWIRSRADAIDPAHAPVRPPLPAKPTADQLAPYLGLANGYLVAGWLDG